MHQPVDKELFHVAGDMPDPSGRRMRGTAPGYDMTQTAIGHPMLFYRLPNGHELVLEADVYRLEGQPLYIHLLCPVCMMAGHTNALTIRENEKSLYYEPEARVPIPPGWDEIQLRKSFPQGLGGKLSVEQIACTWEVTPELQRQFGLGICPWRVVIENNVIRDAR